MIVAPATANCLAKLACGLADGLVSTAVLAAWQACPLLLAPAMNERMWRAPTTQANCARLKEFGARFIGPVEGRLACGTTGPGRLAEPADILARAAEVLRQTPPGDIA